MQPRRIFVISDLHLGGEPGREGAVGFDMCPPPARRLIAQFINWVADAPPPRSLSDEITELVINGDFVDFLAEKPFEAFTGNADAAISKLRQIVKHADHGRPQEARIFPALRRLVGRGHRLTILLGNHDVELSLPRVRRALLDEITEGKPAHIEYLFDGEAYVVGDLLIEHGNRYDGWNAVGMGGLRAYRSAQSRGEKSWEFVAPPGSRLVASLMNPLKKKYRFIDLLKPENEAALPILFALEPGIVKSVTKLAPLKARSAMVQPKSGQVPRTESFVRSTTGRTAMADASETGLSPDDVEMSEQDLDECFNRTQQQIEWGERLYNELARAASGDHPDRRDTRIAASGDQWWMSAWSMFRAASTTDDTRLLHLRTAFAAAREAIGTTFEVAASDPIYHAAAKRLASGQRRVIIFGHTHLARSIDLPGGGRYLNAGTWCPTIRLPEAFYSTKDSLELLPQLRRFIYDLIENRLDEWTTLATTFVDARVHSDATVEAVLCEFRHLGQVVRLSP
jgi:UDP-2,3-diacylglucosamine pyrophosphatase LpxH